MPIKIVEAGSLNLQTLAELAVDCIQDSYREIIPHDFLIHENKERRLRIWIDSLSASNSQAYCALCSGEPVAFVTGRIEENRIDGKVGHVQSLYVTRAFQRKRVGGRLFAEIEKWFSLNSCNVLTVAVLSENMRASSFYEKMGCTFVGHSPYNWHGVEVQLSLYRRDLAWNP